MSRLRPIVLVLLVLLTGASSAFAADRDGAELPRRGRGKRAEVGAERRSPDALTRRSAHEEAHVGAHALQPIARRIVLQDETSRRRRNPDQRDFFVVLFPHAVPEYAVARSSAELVSDVIRPLSGQLIVAWLVFLVLLGWRRIFQNDADMMDRSHFALRCFELYGVLVALTMLTGMLWPKSQRIFLLCGLLVLDLAIIQTFTVIVADGFLVRVRRLRVPVIVRDVIVLVLYVVASVFVLSRHGVDVTSIMTGSVLVTAVIGLAFQDTLGSIASGLAIQLERPYQEGDWILYDGQMGRVLEINWRSTVMQTTRHDVVIIPNRLLTANRLINLTRPDPSHRREVEVTLPYALPPNTAREYLEAAARNANVMLEPPPYALLRAFDNSGIRYVVYFFIRHVQDHDRAEDRVRTSIWYRLKRHGVNIPYPIHEVMMMPAAPAADAARDHTAMAGRVAALARIPFLAPLRDTEREELASALGEASYGKGEVIIAQGDAGESMFLITSGVVEVLLQSGASEPTPVATLSTGDFFGEMSLMTGDARTATVRALEDTHVFVVEHGPFGRLIAGNPVLCDRIAESLERRQAELAQKRQPSGVRDPAASPEAGTLIHRIRAFFGVRP